MTTPVPRLRMFAGPNGSGKSTIKEMLPAAWLGVYINADEIEKSIRRDGFLDLATFEVTADTQELQGFFAASTLLAKAGLLAQAQALAVVDERVVFGAVAVNSYFASVLADFLRHKLLAKNWRKTRSAAATRALWPCFLKPFPMRTGPTSSTTRRRKRSGLPK